MSFAGGCTIQLDDFRLLYANFEGRFEHGWRVWDRTGAIWQLMSQKYPDLRILSGQPTITKFRLGLEYELTLETDKVITQANAPPAALEEFRRITDKLVRTACDEVEIVDFTRVGLRLTFWKELVSTKDASKTMLGLNLLNIPEGTRFGIKGGEPVLPEYCIRWENEDLGATVRIRVDFRGFRADFPLGWEGAASVDEKPGIYLDVDYYTKSLIAVGQLKVEEWILNASRSIRRELDHILQGQ